MTPSDKQKFYERASLVLLVLSCGYFIAELVFNVSLLDVAGTASSTKAEVERVQTFGRVISGVGFTLLLIGVFARNGMRLDNVVYRGAAWGLVVVGMLPFALATGYGPFQATAAHEQDPELIWGLLPILGGVVMLMRQPLLHRSRVLLGVVLIAWPAMFFGQKILIERYLIEPTSAEDRLNARYMSALRTTFEYCLLEIGDLTFCDGGHNRPEARSMLGMSAALFMQKPEIVTDMAQRDKDRILRYLSLNERLFSPDEQYEIYLGMAAGFYDVYLETLARIRQELYAPYAHALSRYRKATSPAAMQKITQELNKEVDAILDAAWQTYVDAVDKNNGIVASLSRSLKDRLDREKMLRRLATGETCAGGNCGLIDKLAAHVMDRDKRSRTGARGNDGNQGILDCEENTGASSASNGKRGKADIAKQLFSSYICRDVEEEELREKVAELTYKEFEKESGYPPDIEEKSDFLNHPKTLELVRDKLPKMLAAKFPELEDVPGADWTPDQTGIIISKVVSYISGRADQHWETAMTRIYGDTIPAGMNMAEFVSHPSIVALMESMAEKMGLGAEVDFSLSQKDFTEEIMIPQNTKIIMDMLAEMQKDAESYGNGQPLAEDGKEYVRAAYVPAIALGLSLFILILTLAKNSSALLNIVMVRTGAPEALRSGVTVVVWGVAVWLVAFLPWRIDGPGDHSGTYAHIQEMVQDEHKAAGVAIDWTLRMQPSVYRLGQKFVTAYRHAGLPDPLGILPDERRHYVPDPPRAPAVVSGSEMLREAQVDLVMLGYLDEGAISARPNAPTGEAVRRFRETNNMPPGSEITPDLARRLMIYTKTLTQPGDE